MDQSKSNDKGNERGRVEMPARSFSVELFVGIFTICALAACAYLAVGLGGMEVGAKKNYEIFAEFDNVAGLKNGASVEIAGVQIGEVSGIIFKDPVAVLSLKIRNEVKIRDDDIASIRTKGIIGDRYVKVSRGASDMYLNPGDTIIETESAIDIEDIIGKVVHSLEGGDEE